MQGRPTSYCWINVVGCVEPKSEVRCCIKMLQGPRNGPTFSFFNLAILEIHKKKRITCVLLIPLLHCCLASTLNL